MSGYAGTLQGLGADIASEQAALPNAWQGDTGMSYQVWQAPVEPGHGGPGAGLPVDGQHARSQHPGDERPRHRRSRQMGRLVSSQMSVEPNAVELTVDHAWFIAETIGAGSFPWVLAITTPYCDAAQRVAFIERQKAELIRMGLVSARRGDQPGGRRLDQGGVLPGPVARPALPGARRGPVPRLLRGIVAQRAATPARPPRQSSRCAARN